MDDVDYDPPAVLQPEAPDPTVPVILEFVPPDNILRGQNDPLRQQQGQRAQQEQAYRTAIMRNYQQALLREARMYQSNPDMVPHGTKLILLRIAGLNALREQERQLAERERQAAVKQVAEPKEEGRVDEVMGVFLEMEEEEEDETTGVLSIEQITAIAEAELTAEQQRLRRPRVAVGRQRR